MSNGTAYLDGTPIITNPTNDGLPEDGFQTQGPQGCEFSSICLPSHSRAVGTPLGAHYLLKLSVSLFQLPID